VLFETLWSTKSRGLIQRIPLLQLLDRNTLLKISSKETLVSISRTSTLKHTSQAQQVGFLDEIAHVLESGLCLTSTGNGFFGMVPRNAFIEDQTWFLTGPSIPVVLRQAEVSATYTVIGASYLGTKECRVDRFQMDEPNSITFK
jgi:hypothetical protein